MQIELTIQEVRTLLAWAEEATSGKFGVVGFTYLTDTESALIDKLRGRLEAESEPGSSAAPSP